MKSVLFVCIHNAGRSQMAEAFFNRKSGSFAIAYSAGTQPSDTVTPNVVQAMAECGIALSTNQPTLLSQNMLDLADRVITMGCMVEESCPTNLVPTEDWHLEDPKGKSLEKVREIREQVRSRVTDLLAEMGIS